MKRLLPSLKEKNRYIVFEVVANQKLSFKEVKEAILKAIIKFLGQLETAKANPLLLNDWKLNKGLLKINNKYLNKVKTALILINKIGKKPAYIKVMGVSGTIKKARLKFI